MPPTVRARQYEGADKKLLRKDWAECAADEGKPMTNKELYFELRGVIADVEEKGFDDVCLETIKRVADALAQPEQEIESDKNHVEGDGCPTEKAVLQRFWREHQAQPESEPVAWMEIDIYLDEGGILCERNVLLNYDNGRGVPLYTAPPRREWQGLTDEDMEDLFLSEFGVRFARYIEAKLKEKNT